MSSVDFAAVAKRLGNWATNLIVSGVVIVVALAMGREIIEWWHADPEPRSEAGSSTGVQTAPLPTSAIGGPHGLTLSGIPAAIRHGTSTADLKGVLDELRRECGAAADQAGGDVDSAPPPGPAERKMLESLTDLRPVAKSGAGWELYQIEQPMPMVAAVSVAERRVLSWGLALPRRSGEGRAPEWSWFTWRLSSTRQERRSPLGDWPDPPRGTRQLAVEAADGLTLVAYTGRGGAGPWRDYYEQWFGERGWTPVDPDRQSGSSKQGDAWQQSGDTARRRWEKAGVGRVDVQLAETDGDQVQCFISLTPK